MEFTLLGAAFGAYAAMTLSAKRLQGDDDTKLADTVLGASMFGLLLGRVWYMVGTGTNPLTHLGDFILIRAGVSTIGAALGFLLLIGWAHRSDATKVLALIAVPTLVGLAGWELGCLVRGTCLGTTAKIGMAANSGIIRHPIGIYTGLLLLGAALLIWRIQKQAVPIWTGPAALGLAALSRGITEPFRLHFGVGMLWWYLAAATVGLTLTVLVRNQNLAPK